MNKKTLKEIIVRCVILANKDLRLKAEDIDLYLDAQYFIDEACLRSLTSKDIIVYH